MLDFNKAHSNSAQASKRIARKKQTKKISIKQLASCEGKVSFETFTAASQVAKKRRVEVRNRRNAYLCYYCRKYHIG